MTLQCSDNSITASAYHATTHRRFSACAQRTQLSSPGLRVMGVSAVLGRCKDPGAKVGLGIFAPNAQAIEFV